jgi:hypothetical protein
MVMQLEPPASYAITTNGGLAVLNTIALSSVPIESEPPFDWKKNQESWFSPLDADLTELLDATAKIRVTLAHRSTQAPEPDETLEETANGLAGESYSFQLYAQSLLTPNNWTQGQPSYGSKAYYFVQENQNTPGALRMLFDVDESSPALLVKLVWISLSNQVSGYFEGAPDGTTLVLVQQPLSSIPENGYYYQALRVT